ncbi:hypothetical protein F750_5078 [Streptomyces sp. PAMC 26508]|nr:hypothetical protein F750_5078 [Streptomyces sp. PAMC 26508]
MCRGLGGRRGLALDWLDARRRCLVPLRRLLLVPLLLVRRLLLRPPGVLVLPVAALRALLRLLVRLIRLLIRLVRLLRALSAVHGGGLEMALALLTRNPLTALVRVSACGCCHVSSSDCRSPSQWCRDTAPYGAVTRNALSVY